MNQSREQERKIKQMLMHKLMNKNLQKQNKANLKLKDGYKEFVIIVQLDKFMS